MYTFSAKNKYVSFCCDIMFYHCRIVCFVGNMSIALSVSRRRSKDFVALTLIRRIVALALVFNIKDVVDDISSFAASLFNQEGERNAFVEK